MNEMRVLFFGMLGKFSQPPLQALLKAGFSIIGVILPTDSTNVAIRKLEPVMAHPGLAAADFSPITLTPKQTNIVHLAWQHNLPVYEISNLSAPETQQILTDLDPDVACVACFNKRIPASLLALPRHGFLNVHPSLLPHFRGPVPMFWTLRSGIQNTGVTVHFMDEALDTGDITHQTPLALPDGLTGSEADALMGTLGAQLLVKTLNQLANNTLIRSPQPLGGSSQPWPQTGDFHIPVSWTARRAYNFMRGAAEFGQLYVIEMGDGEIVVKTAVSFTQHTILGQSFISQGDTIQIQFADGVVTVQIY